MQRREIINLIWETSAVSGEVIFGWMTLWKTKQMQPFRHFFLQTYLDKVKTWKLDKKRKVKIIAKQKKKSEIKYTTIW